MKKYVSFILSIAFAFVCFLSIKPVDINNFAYANAGNEITMSDEKVYTDVNIEDDFSDDTVLVVLNKQASDISRSYSKSDFSEIQCSEVRDLTELTVNKIERNRNNLNDKLDAMRVDEESFRRILSLQLQEPGKEKVVVSQIKSNLW